jgi:hypothetical protein
LALALLCGVTRQLARSDAKSPARSFPSLKRRASSGRESKRPFEGAVLNDRLLPLNRRVDDFTFQRP